MEPKLVRIGRIVGAHGLKGQLKVEPMTDFADRFAPGSRLRAKGRWLTVESFAMHKGRPLMKLEGVDDVQAAKDLQWEFLEAAGVPPKLEEDEYLASELVGMEVVEETGKSLGTVDEVLFLPAQDVLQVGPVMIPIVKEFVRSIDLERRRITVRLIPGMLPGEDDQ